MLLCVISVTLYELRHVRELKFLSDLQLQSLPRRVKIFAYFTDFEKLSRRS